MRTPKNQPEKYEEELPKALTECAKERQEVLAVGGLHILGTERHESRRIDNQLRGRSGRQGDPGSSRFFISLQDELMRLFGSDRVAKMMDVMKWEDGEPIIHPWVTKAIARAQTRVEMMNFDRRKRLLDYDSVMNTQRQIVYEVRDMALLNQDVDTYILEAAAEVLDAAIEADCPQRVPAAEWDTKHLAEFMRRLFAVQMPDAVMSGTGMTREALSEMLHAEVKGSFEAKMKVFPDDVFMSMCRQIILMQVDAKWKDHLHSMDSLREGIGWRGVGGSDPLVEYKNEGFVLFQQMMDTLREEMLAFIWHVNPMPAERRPARRVVEAKASPARGGDEEEKGVPSVKKVGRNDPCPCGSGKKYKKCCGA